MKCPYSCIHLGIYGIKDLAVLKPPVKILIRIFDFDHLVSLICGLVLLVDDQDV